MIRATTLMVATLVLASASASAQLKTPVDWKWRVEGTGSVVDADPPRPTDTRFVSMPPGWHITTGPATLLYHPDYQTRNKDNFAIEAEIFLFPGESQEEYGVFLGGKGLTGTERPSYVVFVARRDGMGMIRRGSGEPIVNWKANDAILPNPGKEAVKNILRVDVGPAEIVYSANGKEVARIPRLSNVNLEGHFGFRFGQNINAHASRLDLTHKLAPVPSK